ncbi:hypothetical protein DCE79_16445 [Lysinibacillus sp. 2017]|uniref:hypothetical protein n=1 Tax=unclassified Lysinibacillus TaxID=2636778 RepID=UPI000D525B7C|nr:MULTISPECIES: hypothetical protein [unclassified Lysinibacillus]AWE08843.1 hypothetical protein DCE79_16445 [Lysinibacillus sp. 2017]TGN36166.1 hypothetical protein E4L99_06825 [Lysinibacillus sp. S2017]
MKPFEEEEALPIEKILRQFAKGHFSNVKENPQEENNNSFIFLEKSSLNLLLDYLFSGTKSEIPPIVNEELELKAIEQLTQVINDTEKEFKAIINLLKEVT